jgi:catechol 2,3-dioxygenase-like lactoylglutathione lyase family enzyme
MAKLDISGIAPFFIVKNVPAATAFYRDRFGFEVTFQGPEPDDIFFGIVQRTQRARVEAVSPQRTMGFTLRTVVRPVTIGIGKLFRITLDRASRAV